MENNPQNQDDLIDSTFVIDAFERATRWLAALPMSGPSGRMKVSRLDVFDPDDEIFKHNVRDHRPAAPDAADIEEMDSVLSWLGRYIPEPRRVLRRIIAERSITRGHDGAPASWASVGRKLGIDYRAAKRWHADAINMIVNGINAE
jgi:hypothetical protein